jgi:ribosomal protein L27
MKKNFNIIVICFPLLILLLFCSSCGQSRPALGKVEGTVTLDGQPIKNGNIIFSTKGTRDAAGIIEDGVIKRVTTFDEGDGTPVGEATVAIIAFKEVKKAPNVSGDTNSIGESTILGDEEFLVPPRYMNPETSGLTATIKKGINKLDFKLQSN